MSISFSCESCGKAFTVDDKFAGKKGKCKQCGATMEIPGGAPSRPAATPPLISRGVEREVSPSRRAPSPPSTPKADVFGLDEAPASRRLATAIDDDGDALLPPRSGRKEDDYFAPPSKTKKKKKKHSAEESGAMVFLRILLGLAIGSAGNYAAFTFISSKMGNVASNVVPGVQSKTALEAMLTERFKLNQDLMTILVTVRDVNSATAASGRANAKIRAISANLRKLRTGKFLKKDLDALTLKFQEPLDSSTKRWVEEFFRIAQIPGPRRP